MSGLELATAYVSLVPSAKGFGAATASAIGPQMASVGKAAGLGLGKAAVFGIGAGVAGAVAIGKGLYEVGEIFDNVKDTIITGTGASGKALGRLEAVAKHVGQTTPSSFEDVGTAVADLNARLGLTGKPLEDMTSKVLNLSRITDTDLSGNIANLTRVFGDWGIKTKDQSKALDEIFFTSQKTGTGIDSLAQSVVQMGAPLRQFGFSFEESLAMFGKWEKEGVNTTAVMSGLKIGLGKFSAAGKDPQEALESVTKAIADAGSAGEANQIAIENFGQRAGPDMAAAVREGRFELDDLVKSIEGSKGSIDDADHRTRDFAETWQMLKNNVLVGLAPIAEKVFSAFAEGAADALPKVQEFVRQFEKGEGTAGDIKDGLNDAKDAVVNFFDEFKNKEGFGGDVRDTMGDIKDAVQGAAGFAQDLVGWFNDMPDWAKKAIITGAVGAALLPKIPGGSAAASGVGSLLGKAVGVQKVFETNPAALGKGGVPGTIPGGGKPTGPLSPGGKTGMFMGAGILAGATAGLAYDPEELGWEKLEGDLLKVNAAFVDIAMSRTGIDNLTGATEGLDKIIAGMTLEKPRQGFSALWDLSQKTGISMADLRDVLPATSKAIEDSGVKARGSARETGAWKDIILDTGKAVDGVDGKKPSVGWLFPGLVAGIGDTGKLGGETDKTGGKKPAIPWLFPGLTAGLFNVQTLGRGIANLPDHKTITITTFHNDTYGGLAGGGGHEPKQPPPSKPAPRTAPSGKSEALDLSDRAVERLATAMYHAGKDGIEGRQTSAHARRRVGA